MPQRHQIMLRRHQVCHENINYATKTLSYAMKTSNMPQRYQFTTKTSCQDTNVTKTAASS